MDQHKRAVGDNVHFESAVRRIFPKTENYALYYSARLDDIGLAAVRADRGVDMVECDGKSYLIE